MPQIKHKKTATAADNGSEVQKTEWNDDHFLDFTQVEVDIGAVALDGKEFVITDAACLTTSKILCCMAYVDIAGSNTADEIWMSRVQCAAGKPQAGSFTLAVWGNSGPISNKFRVNYLISNV